MEKIYSQVFAETLEVIKNCKENIKNKIPQKFIDYLEKNKDNNYVVNINFNEVDWETNLREETKILLALIYRDYVVSKEERMKLIIEEKNEQIKLENELMKKFDSNKLFKNVNSTKKEKSSSETALVKYKENIILKIVKYIKRILG